MNYSEIVNLVLKYSDRQDAEVSDRIDDFLKVVESRINRVLSVGKMTTRSQVTTVADQEYYGLPSDFAGVRDIEITSAENPSSRQTLQYLNPEQMNNLSTNTEVVNNSIFYTIIANQIQVLPLQSDKILEIVYYQNLPALTSVDVENWLSYGSPDVYLFGLMTEVNAFVKDAEAANLWDSRFKESLAELTEDDAINRWSGSPLQMRVG